MLCILHFIFKNNSTVWVRLSIFLLNSHLIQSYNRLLYLFSLKLLYFSSRSNNHRIQVTQILKYTFHLDYLWNIEYLTESLTFEKLRFISFKFLMIWLAEPNITNNKNFENSVMRTCTTDWCFNEYETVHNFNAIEMNFNSSMWQRYSIVNNHLAVLFSEFLFVILSILNPFFDFEN